MVEISSACRLVRGKGQDRLAVLPLNKRNDEYLIAVADGLTHENGGDAAEWTIATLRSIAQSAVSPLSARTVFRSLSKKLQESSQERTLPESHTTLTCGIVRWERDDGDSIIHFDFFAIGDSPVWKIVPVTDDELEFQGFTVHAGPFPSEQGRVYSTVDLRAGSIRGAVHFGSVSIQPSEALMVVSDGIPDARLFWDDQDPKRSGKSPRLGRRLIKGSALTDKGLANIIKDYDRHRLLVDDDASVIAVRFAPNLSLHIDSVAPVIQKTEGSSGIGGDSSEDQISLDHVVTSERMSDHATDLGLRPDQQPTDLGAQAVLTASASAPKEEMTSQGLAGCSGNEVRVDDGGLSQVGRTIESPSKELVEAGNPVAQTSATPVSFLKQEPDGGPEEVLPASLDERTGPELIAPAVPRDRENAPVACADFLLPNVLNVFSSEDLSGHVASDQNLVAPKSDLIGSDAVLPERFGVEHFSSPTPATPPESATARSGDEDHGEDSSPRHQRLDAAVLTSEPQTASTNEGPGLSDGCQCELSDATDFVGGPSAALTEHAQAGHEVKEQVRPEHISSQDVQAEDAGSPVGQSDEGKGQSLAVRPENDEKSP